MDRCWIAISEGTRYQECQLAWVLSGEQFEYFSGISSNGLIVVDILRVVIRAAACGERFPNNRHGVIADHNMTGFGHPLMQFHADHAVVILADLDVQDVGYFIEADQLFDSSQKADVGGFRVGTGCHICCWIIVE